MSLTCEVAGLLKEGGIGVSKVDGVDENGPLLSSKDAVHERDVLPWDVRGALNNEDTAVLGG